MSANQDFFEDTAWCQATTLTERLASWRATGGTPHNHAFKGADADIARRRIMRWRSQAPFSSGSWFAQRLAADGLSEDDLLNFLGESGEAVHSRLAGSQSWVAELFDALSRPVSPDPLPLPDGVRHRVSAGFLNVIDPVIREGLERVQVGAHSLIRSRSGLPFDASSITAMLFAILPHQLLAMLSGTAVLELNVARLDGLLEGATAEERFRSFLDCLRQCDFALALLREYPVLARQLVVRINHWVDFSLEFLQHFAADWESICAEFASGDNPGTLVDLRGDLGDAHRGGRSVLIAKFSSGLEVVYKPRALRVDLHFQELLNWLNLRGKHPIFRTLKILDRGSHGWVEFIAAEGCGSVEEVRRFYEHQGAYLALLYALEAVDFHFENLVAAGEYPVLLDLEALFHPRAGGVDIMRQADAIAGSAIDNSVLRVGLLPQFTWSDDPSFGVDLSGLATPPGQLTPQPVPRWEGAGSDEMRLIHKRVEMPAGRNRPDLNGTAVNVLDYADAISAGFTSLYRLLVAHRGDLLSGGGPLARFDKDEVRAILRPTQVYGVLLNESFHPDVLRNALDRDRMFDRLWNGVVHLPHLARVIAAERRDLENGDVPIFTTCPGSRDLWTSSRERIADFFEESGMARARRRIQQLSEQDCSRQIWFIRAALASLSKGADTSLRQASRLTQATTAPGHGRLMAAAHAVGDRLEQLALRGEHDISWIGLTLADRQHWFVTPLGIDLYDGLPGVALFLAHLGEITEESRYTECARAALVTLRGRLETEAPHAGIGAFSGLGGIIYALTHLGSLWKEPALLRQAEGIVDLLPPLIALDKHLDIIGGAAGCIGALAALYDCAPSGQTLAAAIQCGDHLLARAQPLRRGIGWSSGLADTHPLAGFSHGAAGIAWALLEVSALSGQERFRTAALAAIEYERSLFSAESENWRDLRHAKATGLAADGGAEFAMAWCHGAPGIGLARLLCLRHLDDVYVRSEINVALETTLARGFGHNHCLCHGALGNLELMLQASLTFPEPRWQAEVDRVAADIIQSIDRNGWLFGNPLGVESPGFMTGLAGIGYEMLRLAEPTRVPSILSLAPPFTP